MTPGTDNVGKYLRATATYKDKAGGNLKTAKAVSDRRVQKAPEVNAPPRFTRNTDTRSVAENAAPEVNIGAPVTATDTDKLTYTLGGTDAASFDIVADSGQLQTKAALDYETKSQLLRDGYCH